MRKARKSFENIKDKEKGVNTYEKRFWSKNLVIPDARIYRGSLR